MRYIKALIDLLIPKGCGVWHSMPGMVVLVVLAGCQSAHRSIEVDELKLSERGPLSCPLALTEVTDNRESVMFSRMEGGDSYELEGVSSLIQEEVSRWQPTQSSVSAAEPIEVRLALVRAYGEYKGSSNVATVVLLGETEDGRRQALRGQYSLMNWWGSQEEARRAFSGALHNSLVVTRDWFESLCDQVRLEAGVP